ncbi:response regulator transcription factor [Phragmitibacter flavus]|uniref:Response regulator transcription factor n=1 Tax=Phragmitibacter flavus TaxID=2576071 RepID=A0A5R8KIN5_9BACT|nr:response regulator [Phragmitibacter flavus]TLD72101.1 response regulator transcription factor [Phragmitibacter flavus]
MTETIQLVCIVDDDISIRKSLARLFRSAGLAAETFESAKTYLARPKHDGPSCLILDVRMPELTGLDLQQALLDKGLDEQIVFITGNGDIPMCVQAMKAGAVDFLPKPFEENELIAAVERALTRSGGKLHQQATQIAARDRVQKLTPREFQVFEKVIVGKLNKEIAAELGTSIKTVKVQRGRVMEKMGVVSVAELVRMAQYAGIEPSAGPKTKVR